MQNPQGNQEGNNLSLKDSFNILYVVAMGHATCFIPFFRKNFGSEALGWSGLAAFVLMILVGALGQIPEMWPFLGVWVVVMLCRRAGTMLATRRGIILHSRYEGDVNTWLIKNRAAVKLLLEPLVCVILAVCFKLIGLSHGFALFFGWGAASLMFVAIIERQFERNRVRAMRDAAIEQKYFAARFHGEMNDP